VRVANQLRDLLWRYFPQLIKLSPALDEPWLWDLLQVAPLPEQAAKLRRSRIEKLLRSHRIRRLNAEDVTAELKQKLCNSPHVRRMPPVNMSCCCYRFSDCFTSKENRSAAAWKQSWRK
jgi:hypothetical protein